MDLSFVMNILKLIFILPFILFLIYISIKYGGKYMNNLNNGGIIRVHERVPLSQNTFISVITIGDKPYIVSNGERGAEILMELDMETFNKYKKTNQESNLINCINKHNLFKRKDENEKNS